MKKDINYNKLNDLISLAHVILKVLFVLLIILGSYSFLKLIKEIHVVPIILTILKIIAPLFIGFFIAWLFEPIVSYLSKKKVKRGLAAALCYVVFFGLIIMIVNSLIPLLYEQINDFVTLTMPNLIETFKTWINDIFVKFQNVENFDALAVRNDIYQKMEVFATGITSKLPETLVMIVKGLVSGVGTFGLGLIIGFYLLLDFDKNADAMYSLFPKKQRKEMKKCITAINRPLKRFVTGALIDCLIIFIISSIGFSLIGLKAPLLFALFCAITNVIPYAGPYIGGFPAVLVGLTQSVPVGISVLIFVVVVQAIEGNFIQPFIMSKTTKLNPVTIMLGLLIFGHFFGILGMVISTPIIGAIKELINYFDEKYKIFNFD